MGGGPGSSLLLLGELQSVAEDFDSLLLMTGSTRLGKLTVEAEHLPEDATHKSCSPLRTGPAAPPGAQRAGLTQGGEREGGLGKAWGWALFCYQLACFHARW